MPVDFEHPWRLLLLLVLIPVIIIFIRSPWGQNIIVDKVVNYVSEKTNTRVEIEKLFITFDGDVQLNGLYLEDKKAGNPWATNLPFPVQVLEKTEVIDHISKTKLVTAYKYHHGYYDGKEREFRGFGRVDQYDTEIFDDFQNSICLLSFSSIVCLL